jgi:hypothetical protein
MALITREINNTGDPLCSPAGSLLAAVEITFLLVGSNDRPADAWDAVSGERVAPLAITETTDEGGLFSASLWPNDRGSEATFYLCTVAGYPSMAFRAALASGTAPISWIQFMAQGSPLSPTDLSALQDFLAQIEASELAAADSATASAVSAGESADSAAAALVSAGASADSALASAASAVESALSEGFSATSAEESAVSAAAAAASAGAAAASEQAATEKAADALASAAAADNRAGAAAGSAAAADDSAITAAGSAVASAGSAAEAAVLAAAVDTTQIALDRAATAADAAATAADAAATAADAAATAADAAAASTSAADALASETAADASASAAAASAIVARAEIVVDKGNVSGAVTLDLSTGTVFKATAVGACTWSVINAPAGVASCTLMLTDGGKYAQTATGFKTQYGFVIDFSYTGTDWVELASPDGWTTKVWGISWKDVR